MYTTQQLVALARSIADMANSKFITADDESSFLNEAYKAVYSKYVQTGGEFWTLDTIVQPTDANKTVNGKGFEYLIDLPIDFYQLRGVDWDQGATWAPCQRVSWSQRDYIPSAPGYRLKNSKLLLLTNIRPQFRVTYYPVPDTLTVGSTPIDYPTAEMYEIVAYEMALSFLRKQPDQAKLGPVQAKCDTLWARFEQILKQDQYQFERIQNDYATSFYPWA